MKKTLIAVLSLTAVSLSGVNGQVFTGNFTFGSSGNVTSFVYNGSAVDNIIVSALTKNGVNTSSSSGNFRASNWALDTSPGALAGNVDTSKFFEFSLTPVSGFTFNINSLSFGVGRSGTGPRSFQWRSSLDSFSAPVTGFTSTNAALNQASGILTYNADVTTSAANNILTLSNQTYDNLSGVTFRFYAFNAEASGGTGGLEGNFSFSGEAFASVPEPSTWALIGLGSAFVLWRMRRKSVDLPVQDRRS